MALPGHFPGTCLSQLFELPPLAMHERREGFDNSFLGHERQQCWRVPRVWICWQRNTFGFESRPVANIRSI